MSLTIKKTNDHRKVKIKKNENRKMTERKKKKKRNSINPVEIESEREIKKQKLCWVRSSEICLLVRWSGPMRSVCLSGGKVLF